MCNRYAIDYFYFILFHWCHSIGQSCVDLQKYIDEDPIRYDLGNFELQFLSEESPTKERLISDCGYGDVWVGESNNEDGSRILYITVGECYFNGRRNENSALLQHYDYKNDRTIELDAQFSRWMSFSIFFFTLLFFWGGGLFN